MENKTELDYINESINEDELSEIPEDLEELMEVKLLLEEAFNPDKHIPIQIAHMLKFENQKNKQHRPWVNTILGNEDNLKTYISDKKFGSKRISKLNDNLDKYYTNGLKLAQKETGMSDKEFEKSVLKSWTIEDFADWNKCMDFMEKNLVPNSYAEKELKTRRENHKER